MVCHGKDVVRCCHSLGSQLSNGMKAHLMDLTRQGAFPCSNNGSPQVDAKEKTL
jgi:hypothetical protein